MALKVLRGIEIDITESGHCNIMTEESTNARKFNNLLFSYVGWTRKMIVCEEYIGPMSVT